MNMTPAVLYSTVFIAYTLLIFWVTWVTSRRADNETFFIGNRRSPWFVVAYGMIGASLSGVTFMSVPGAVARQNFYYMPMVFGFFVGYLIVATVLMPLYYRMNLTSIYGYLEHRFGVHSYRTGAAFFILSRCLGATLRMFLVVEVLYLFILRQFGMPFEVAAILFIALILAYTMKGGIRTIVWTDTLQTTFMLLAVVLSICFISREMRWDFATFCTTVSGCDYFRFLDTDWHSGTFFLKQFFSGIFVTIAMTGLDQEMMQKNLSCRNIHDAQKNMYVFSGILIAINLLFLTLGAVLAIYLISTPEGTAQLSQWITDKQTDRIFPTVAFEHLGTVAGLVFFVGLISSAYPSADGALTSLTTSFCIDVLAMERRKYWDEMKRRRIRYVVHVAFALLFLGLILFFNVVRNDAIINLVYDVASYTYGPLLGLFLFGILTKRRVRDAWIPGIAVASPLLCFVCEFLAERYCGFSFGFTLLIVNGAYTFLGCLLTSRPAISGSDPTPSVPSTPVDVSTAPGRAKE
ncbi:MAG: sodium:solute symporter [Planctomycetia bacterium]|nr:sodium:solute symporter [Planctomycetia bacterium]